MGGLALAGCSDDGSVSPGGAPDRATSCQSDERVVSNSCVACEPGSTNPAGDDPSGADTACDPVLCEANERVASNRCVACEPGTSNPAGDAATGDDTTCESARCETDERVTANACVACPPGSTNAADDDASGPDTECDRTRCAENERVVANACVACDPGSTNASDDDATGENTLCDPILCAVDQQVVSNACMACAPGNTNAAGDDATGGDTSCDPVICAVNERVASNACVACEAGTFNTAGDEATGGDTAGDSDPCQARFGITCGQATDAYLKASNSEAEDSFGAAVSVFANRLAVGAAGEDSCARGLDGSQTDDRCDESGAVYLFERDPSSGAWDQVAYIKSNNSDGDHLFGGAVSLWGDRLAVGASGEDNCAGGIDPQDGQGCLAAGAVYVFERDSDQGRWSQTAYIKAAETDIIESFGRSVSLRGDRLAVGSSGEDSCDSGVDADQTNNQCSGAGAVYLFEWNPTTETWSQTVYFKASNPDESDAFGVAISLGDDLLAVGASGEDSCSGEDPNNNECDREGAAYVFERDPIANTWSETAYIKASITDTRGLFGRSLSLSGDRLAVGAPSADAVYLFERDPAEGTWSEVGRLEGLNTANRDSFGTSVSLRGDRLAVGASDEESCADGFEGDPEDDDCDGSGATYVFERDPREGGWSQIVYLKAPNSELDDGFGSAVFLDENGLVVGAPAEASCADGVDGNSNSNACVEAGAAYAYRFIP